MHNQYSKGRWIIFLEINDSFVAVYMDDILVFSKNKKKHIGHLQIVLKKFEEHDIINK